MFDLDLKVSNSNIQVKPSAHTAIVGLGNPLRGDDGIGLEVLDHLRRMDVFHEDVILLEPKGGELLLPILMGGYQRMIFIDAVNFGGEPGEWKYFSLEPEHIISKDICSCLTLHYLRLSEIVRLGMELSIQLPKILIYGVQPLRTDFTTNISEVVLAAIPKICESIINTCETKEILTDV